jgi:hypothetical protein
MRVERRGVTCTKVINPRLDWDRQVTSPAWRTTPAGPSPPAHSLAALYFSQKGNPPAINQLTRLQPQVEAESIHGGHRGLVGDLA